MSDESKIKALKERMAILKINKEENSRLYQKWVKDLQKLESKGINKWLN